MWGEGWSRGDAAAMPSTAVTVVSSPVLLPGGGVIGGGSGRNCLSDMRERGFHGMMTGNPLSRKVKVTSRGLWTARELHVRVISL